MKKKENKAILIGVVVLIGYFLFFYVQIGTVDKKIYIHEQSNAIAETKSKEQITNAENEIIEVKNEDNITIEQKNALEAARTYIGTMPFSKSELTEQLKHDGYNGEAITYAVENCNADWNKQAEDAAKAYISIMAFSRQELINQLKHDGYTDEQAQCGVTAIGY